MNDAPKNPNNVNAQLALGALLGLLMPILGIVLMLWARPELGSLQKFSGDIVKTVNVQIITLGMLINAGLFFLFLRWQKEPLSRGILLISVAELVVIFIYRFVL